MPDRVHFEIDDGAAHHVLLIGAVVEELATLYLKANPHSADFHRSRTSDAIRAMQTASQLISAFSQENSTSVQEKQLAYHQFVSTIVQLAKSPGDFSRKLKAVKINDTPLMDEIYNNISQLIYKRRGIAHQIRDHWDAHLEIIKGDWFPSQRRLEAQNLHGLRRR